MPHQSLFESPLYTSNLYDSKQKSRSHLVLFETVEQYGRHQRRQTEHQNAFGYLGQSFYEPPSSSSTPIRHFSLANRRRNNSPVADWPTNEHQISSIRAASRNESSAVRAVLGIVEDKIDSYHHHYRYPRQVNNDDNLPVDQWVASGGKFTSSSSHCLARTPPPLSSSPQQQFFDITSEEKFSAKKQQRNENHRRHSISYNDNCKSSLPYTTKNYSTIPVVTTQYPNSSCFLAHNFPYTQPPQPKLSLAAQRKRAFFSSSTALHNFSMNDQNEQQQQSSQNRILIKGGRCVNDDAIFDADIYIEDGIIKDIGPHLIVPGGSKIIEAKGLYVLPGGIDTHTHLNACFEGTNTADDFYSGTKAALAGGTTTVMDFVIPKKGESLIEAYKKWRSFADGIACCDYVFRVAITEFIKGKTDLEMETLVKEYGINSFKCFMAYKNLMLHDNELIQVFHKCRELGTLPVVHAENGDIIDYNILKLKNLGISGPEGHLYSRPEEVEAEATQRAIMLANQVGCPVYIVHVNSRSAADVIASARNRGVVAFGEPIAAGIGSDGTHYFNRCWNHAAGHVMSPPLRADKTTPEHLINLLASGQLQTTGSDHCVFKSSDKAKGKKDFALIPNGVNGVEERMMIVWEKGVKTGKLDPKQFVAVTSTNAAKIFNIYPRKGRLAKGSDGDVVIWGPKPRIIKADTHNSNVDFNIFEGTHVSYGPQVVISNGRLVLDETGLHLIQGSGRYVSCAPNSNYVWSALIERNHQPPVKVNREESAKNGANGVPAQKTPTPPSTAPIQTNGDMPPPLSIPPQPASAPIESQYYQDQYPNDGSSTPAFYKGTTRSGVRNLQDSSFSLTGAQIDDDKIGKTAIRVHNPPGGRSSGIW